MPIPLSILDLAPVAAGASAVQALQNSIELARLADRLGYTRYWLAEHHNTPGIASSAPEILIGRLAQETQHLRIGSGGVMLPNHVPLKIVEVFRMLEALYPGRIDLGIGRAPGTDQLTALAIRRSVEALRADDFPEQVAELLAFADDAFPEDHPFRAISAVPVGVVLPPLWLLGSSDFSARLAAQLGLGYAFARHINPDWMAPAMQIYRQQFTPSTHLAQPHAILTVSALCAETADHAEWLAHSLDLAFLRLRSGRPGQFPSPEEAAAYPYTPAEQAMLRTYRKRVIIGTPEKVRNEILELAQQSAADEVMVLTITHDPAERMRAYELLAAAFGLAPAGR